MKPRLLSVPLTEEDLEAWVAVLERCPGSLYLDSIACDDRDSLIMLAAQQPIRCPCCGGRFSALESHTGGRVTDIPIRAPPRHHRPRLH